MADRSRIYALSSFTVWTNGKGWYVRKTDSNDRWRGPFSSETSACLMIARQLRKELARRDNHHSEPRA